MKNLKNKKILITAGPTWVPIDSVRVISNIATGETGLILAEEADKLGAKVTLLLGQVKDCCLDKSIRLLRFRFFDELRDKLIQELSSRKYDVIIHNAAVSDFKPGLKIKGKLSSGKKYNLELIPLPKIVQYIKKLVRQTKLVIFKLESDISDRLLIQRAKKTQLETGADIIVANRFEPYRAFIIDKKDNIILASSKNELAKKLLKNI